MTQKTKTSGLVILKEFYKVKRLKNLKILDVSLTLNMTRSISVFLINQIVPTMTIHIISVIRKFRTTQILVSKMKILACYLYNTANYRYKPLRLCYKLFNFLSFSHISHFQNARLYIISLPQVSDMDVENSTFLVMLRALSPKHLHKFNYV